MFSHLPMHKKFQPIDNGFYSFHSFLFCVSPCDIDCGKNHCNNFLYIIKKNLNLYICL